MPERPQLGPNAGGQHVFEHDRVTGTTVRVDDMDGVASTCPGDASSDSSQAVSADGSYVTYNSLLGLYVSATNPVAVYVTRLR